MSKNKVKGDSSLYVMGLVIILSLLLFFGVQFILKDSVTKAKLNIDLAVSADDMGTWVTSFLMAESGGKSYMEILGSTSAGNYSDHLSADLDRMRSTMEKTRSVERAGRSVSVPGTIKIGNESADSGILSVDIPFPGGIKSGLEVRS